MRLEVESVPILAWNDDTFKNIDNKQGEIISMDCVDDRKRCSIHLGIKTSHSQLILKTSNVKIF